MKYFKVRKVNYPPFLIFDLVAYNLKELEVKKLIQDGVLLPGILTENALPGEQDGICEMDLDQNGNLVQRAESEFKKSKLDRGKKEALEEIEKCKSYLNETDWIIAKCSELGINVQKKYPEYYIQRENARKRINSLESELQGLN